MDPLPGDPREHMDVLLDFLIRFAQQSLGQHDGFYPFGVSMASDGELAAVGGYEGEDEPTAPELFDLIVHGLHARAASGQLLATAVCIDVTLTEHEFPLAIRVDLEHRDAKPLTCVLPYRHSDEGYEYGELLAYPGDTQTFA